MNSLIYKMLEKWKNAIYSFIRAHSDALSELVLSDKLLIT